MLSGSTTDRPELPSAGTQDAGIDSAEGTEALDIQLQNEMVSVRHLAR